MFTFHSRGHCFLRTDLYRCSLTVYDRRFESAVFFLHDFCSPPPERHGHAPNAIGVQISAPKKSGVYTPIPIGGLFLKVIAEIIQRLLSVIADNVFCTLICIGVHLLFMTADTNRRSFLQTTSARRRRSVTVVRRMRSAIRFPRQKSVEHTRRFKSARYFEKYTPMQIGVYL